MFCVEGLAAGGKTYDNCKAVCKAVDFYLSTQNEEDSWEESIQSCRNMLREIQHLCTKQQR
ncbi:hypothetical protein LguiA_027937 [Lonicera macranthoides]